MRKLGKILLTCLLGIFLILPKAFATIGLGTIQLVKSITANPGDEIEFKSYLFNLGPPQKVVIYVNAPKGWEFSIIPSEIILDRTIDKVPNEQYTYVKLPNVDGYVRLIPLTLKLKIPEALKDSSYQIDILIKTAPEGGEVVASQERQLNFLVKLNLPKETKNETREINRGYFSPSNFTEIGKEEKKIGKNLEENSTKKREIPSQKEGLGKITGAFIWQQSNLIFSFLAIVLGIAFFLVLSKTKNHLKFSRIGR